MPFWQSQISIFFSFSGSLLQHFSGKRPMRLMMITYVSLASAGSTQHRYNHATLSHNTVGPHTCTHVCLLRSPPIQNLFPARSTPELVAGICVGSTAGNTIQCLRGTLSHALFLSPCLTHTYNATATATATELSLSHAHTHTLSLSLSHTHIYTFTHTHTHRHNSQSTRRRSRQGT